MSGFCIDCGLRVESFEGLDCCPNCKSTSIPCHDGNQVSISVNWQELRVLCIWAERWGHEKAGGAGTVYGIAQRLEKQFPDMVNLTLAGEIDEIKSIYGSENVETNVPGVE